MAKIKYPLFSKEVRGSIFGQLTFSKKITGQQCRSQNSQVDFVNPARVYVRHTFKLSTQWWNLLTADEKLTFSGYSKADI